MLGPGPRKGAKLKAWGVLPVVLQQGPGWAGFPATGGSTLSGATGHRGQATGTRSGGHLLLFPVVVPPALALQHLPPPRRLGEGRGPFTWLAVTFLAEVPGSFLVFETLSLPGGKGL